jgi:hypothetical protein
MYNFAGGPITGMISGGILGSMTGSVFLGVMAFVLISLGFAAMRIIPKSRQRQA